MNKKEVIEAKHKRLCFKCIKETGGSKSFFDRYNDMTGTPIIHHICPLFEEFGEMPKEESETRYLVPDEETRTRLFIIDSLACECQYYIEHIMLDSPSKESDESV